MRYCELVDRPAHYLSITRDTTEADLKQRAEVTSRTLRYVDQAPVRCAIEGRILILEGIEKAERNVLPTLNNLLENREMALDDGRFLVAHTRYDALRTRYSQEEMDRRKLVRVHPDFRVIALGLPVPRFPGYPLDPPLRSRFQARAIAPLSMTGKLTSLRQSYGSVDDGLLTKIVSFGETLRLIENQSPKFVNKMPHFPDAGLNHMAALLALFPSTIAPRLLSAHLVQRVFPFPLICDHTQIQTVWETMDRFGIDALNNRPSAVAAALPPPPGVSPLAAGAAVGVATMQQTIAAPVTNPFSVAASSLFSHLSQSPPSLDLLSITSSPSVSSQHIFGTAMDILFGTRASPHDVSTSLQQHIIHATGGLSRIQNVTFPPSFSLYAQKEVHHPTTSGSGSVGGVSEGVAGKPFVETPFHRDFLAPVIQDHVLSKAVCIVGPKGCGKTAFVRYLSSRLGYEGRVHTIHLFKDMTSRGNTSICD
jgi:hypothetical protein